MPAPDAGRYLLLLALRRPRWLTVGALGRHRFPPGSYLYVGSAQRALAARVRRHLRREKRRRWHIDALTSLGEVRRTALLLPGTAESECALNQRLRDALGLAIPVPRFGASDCTAGCGAHLGHRTAPLAVPEVLQALAQSAPAQASPVLVWR